MRNIFMFLTVVLLLTACGEDTITNGTGPIDTTPPPTTTTPTLSMNSYVSIIKNPNNTYGDYCINGLSKAAGDTVTLAFEKPEDESSYKLTQGYVFDKNYCFSITSDLKDYSVTTLNAKVTNRNGTVIFDNNQILLLTIYKYFPYDTVNKMPLANIFDFSTEKTQVIVLNQLEQEYSYKYGDDYSSGMINTTHANIKSYSFTSTPSGDLDGTVTSNNYTVDDATESFTYGSTSYPNCLVPSTRTTTPCAISVTYNGTGGEKASFYIRLNSPEYPDTKLDFFSN